MSEDCSQFYIETELPVKFEIFLSDNIFHIKNKELLYFGSHGSNARRIVVVDLKVSILYIDTIKKYFKFHKIECLIIIIDAIEDNKNIETLLYLLGKIEDIGPNRRDEPIIAVGGGVLMDIVGMAAGLYRRGVPYIKVPTTLLGVVDASVGVKTGVNFKNRRNRLGSYYPPIAAYLDKGFFKTLNSVEISSGLGEILKLSVIKDLQLFEILENHGSELLNSKLVNCKYSDEVINLSIEGMKVELQDNLWERNLKRSVDFGHSFSPILEIRSLSDEGVPSLTHGQAVALDVIFSSIISHTRGFLPASEVLRIVKTTHNLGLPTCHPYFYNRDILMEALNDTTKHRNGCQNLPVPYKIGQGGFINDLTYDDLQEVVKLMEKFNNECFK